MKSTYEFSIEAECPVDGEHITFSVSVAIEGMVSVEGILEHCKRLTDKPIMQEPFTEKLAGALVSDVTTIGTHSGVRITCTAQGGHPMIDTRANEGGYSPRFDITRTDGQPIDQSRRYMVLSFDGSDPDAVAALQVYASLKRDTNPQLSADLLRHLGNPADAPAQHRWAK